MSKYDYIICGRWRNHEMIREVLDSVRNAGKTAYCFVENSYSSDGIEIDANDETRVEEFMRGLETLTDWKTNATFREIFEKDMNGIRDAKEVIIVFPAGLSAHMELGAAYGMGKPCYGIGAPEKNETLYLMFNEIYPDLQSFVDARLGVVV